MHTTPKSAEGQVSGEVVRISDTGRESARKAFFVSLIRRLLDSIPDKLLGVLNFEIRYSQRPVPQPMSKTL
jgi:hypothetical protein